MNVVNYSEAARNANVSRQMIGRIKKLHDDNIDIKPYFVFDPKTGKPGIDIDNKVWLHYVDRNNYQRVNKKKQSNTTKLQPNNSEQPKSNSNNNMIQAVAETLQQELRLPKTEMNKIFNKIEKRYKELENGK